VAISKTCSVEALTSGNWPVAILLSYGFLNATTYAIPTIAAAAKKATPASDATSKSQGISGVNVLSAATIAETTSQPTDNSAKISPMKRARLPSLALVFLLSRTEPSIHSALPWTIRARPMPSIVNAMPIGCNQEFISMFITSCFYNYTTPFWSLLA
jgi:hypothetical protein